MPELVLNFKPLDKANLSADIARQIRRMSNTGALVEGARLPSTRVLARELAVSRGTVVAAMETLIAEGYLESRVGAGTYVARGCSFNRPTSLKPAMRAFNLDVAAPDIDVPFGGRYNFQVCRPATDEFPQNAWRKAMADAASRRPDNDYGDPQGEPELRIEIASYLCRARGLDVNPDQILVTNGAIHAMHILSRVLLSGNDQVAFEDPGYPLARQTFAASGAGIVPVPVDQHGIRVDELPSTDHSIRAIYVTPSHQFPTGERLSLARRHQLIKWATDHDALIVEDDYDGEFRYDVAPLPPMAAMANDGSILYCGTFSKTLFPSLRIGFAAGAPSLINAMTKYRAMTDYQTGSQSQRALAAFIARGDFERHVYRMRRRYARKRKVLTESLRRHALAGKLTGTDSGLNAMIRLSGRHKATQLAARARLNDVGVTPLARYTLSPDIADDALVLGYAALDEDAIEAGIELMVRAISEEVT